MMIDIEKACVRASLKQTMTNGEDFVQTQAMWNPAHVGAASAAIAR
jgi:hypothetical protein